MILNFISIIFGFVFLYFGAEGLVRGSSSIAQSFKISSFVIGLTIVAIGTSIPELVVNIIASINNNPAIAIGNIVGSNIANILLILGVAALVSDLPIKDNTVLSEIPFSLIATLLLGFLANASLFDKRSFLIISRLDGGILLFFFALFILYIFKLSKKYGNAQDGIRVKIMSLPRSIIYIIFGITALLIGAKWVVDGAIKLSEFWVFSQGFLGLTMVALGTSLPELVTSLVAA
ncbi:sodium:calcium antiporter, partial [bacterium]|nr:sodium:calcium antiporter [bacterium]